MKVNLDGIAPWTGMGDLPPGRYLAKVIAATEEQSKAGNPMIVVEFEVTGGPWGGASMTAWFVTVGKAAGKAVAMLEALGVAIPGADAELDLATLVGKAADIVVRPEVGKDGKARATIAGVQAAGTAPPGETGEQAQVALPVGAVTADDDLPF